MLRFSTRAVSIAVLVFSMSAQADTLGPLDGRSPDPGQISPMSVEVGYVSEDELTTIAGRFNYQMSPVLSLYGDFGIVEVGQGDGNTFGVGVRYYLPNQRIAPQLDIGVRGSYHVSNVDFSTAFASAESDFTELALAVHVGGKEAFYANGMKWYGVVSYNRQSADSSLGQISSDTTDSDIGFGGGVYMPLGPGEAYVGVEKIDEMYFGIGYRHFLGGASY
jgi:hypothetical protein